MPAMICAGCCETVDLEYDEVYWNNKVGEYVCEACNISFGVVYKPWTTEEEQYIRKYYAHDGSKCIARALDRTVYSVQHKAQRMGIRNRSNGSPWSSSDDNYLIKHYQTKTARSIGEQLNRSIRSVRCRASVLRQNGADIQLKGK